MLGKTKNFLFNLYKKKTILFVFFFSFFGLTFARSVSANWVLDIIFGIPSRGILLIFWVFARLAVKIVHLAGFILNWVLSPGFTTLSYTNPANNEIIKTGLGVTQGFVNMLLVLILVYIAIATILRLAGYETKKLLITFIIVALLVNFAPVICGLIVDASNIIMNFFIQDLGTKAFAQKMGAQVNDLLSGFDWMSLKVDTALPRVFQIVIMTGFLLVLAFILSLFSIIFILRYLVIWLLVILSPLAFACYILPITRKYFDKWWEQFINWSFIGISCGFFLYLGLLLVTKIPNSIPAPQTGETPIFNNILPYFVSAIFLGIGLVFGLQTSAIGASTVVSFAKARGRGTLRGAAKGAGWVAKKTARGVGRWGEEKFKIREKIAKIPQAMEKHRVIRWFTPEPLKKYAEYRPALEKAQTEAKAYSSLTNMDDVMTGAAVGKKAVGKTLETISRGDSEDIFDAGRREFGKNLSDEQLLQHKTFRKKMKRILEIAKQGGMHNDITRRDPRLAALMAGEEWAGDYATMTEEDAVKQAARESRGGHIANMEKQVVSKEHGGLPVTESFMERGREPFENIARNVKEGVTTVQDSIDTLFSDYIDNVLSKTNSTLANMVRSGDPKNTKVAWDLYREDFKEKHQGREGIFVALKSQRFIDLGYREGKYIKPGAPPPTPTAGGAGGTMGMDSPPPSPTPSTGSQGKKASDIPTTGKGGKKASDIPTTGEEGKKETKPKKEVQVPTMITRKMRTELKKAGYADEDIKKMTPKEAWEKLGRTF